VERIRDVGGVPVAIIIRILINAAALWVAVAIVGGLEFDGEWWALLIIALIMGVVNVVVRPILTILSLPAIVLTLGLFLFIVNAAVLGIVIWVSDSLGLGLTSDGFFWSTFLGAIVVSLVSWGLETVLGRLD
jgi:putative membrane protein